ncbi:UDP-N-acetylglucosamine 2-epimerase (non-hydrolyzing) [Aequorivita sp. F47161]|uniref:UDP-N-acetylglucosamine 2-epimerase (non-hydrolyzing) n=1 Tax=Aequorivita vitellina TaxID=2874475 RepID=A0A9X1R075_9FLAO|nr:UDP-N-acetylglucosamine 2-epimerase (non-hydrolyzing) [Aequorivita vitellina]MCG2419789.1 UDP-N-acetylglucosamine 2-epimerase (non-hydrolyzing) [Aequorivita vitellina]
MKKVLIVFGTRPEAIKMAPLVKEFELYPEDFDTRVCVTAQHREMLDQVLTFFDIKTQYDLDLMKPGQDLYRLTAAIITELKPILEDFKPNYVFVHGDTTTTMASSIAGFYSGAKVCHIEAGLRTHNKYAPFPEEINRQITGRVTDFHFSPTEASRKNLLRENIDPKTITVTGNTVIDALLQSVAKVKKEPSALVRQLDENLNGKSLILVTGHRRENHGDGFIRICEALKTIALQRPNIEIIYPVHLNPKVLEPVNRILGNIKNIQLIDPLAYHDFIWMMDRAKIIITDSGGVQEEAPSLGKPVLVMRETTERPEAVDAGTVILVGTDTEKIIQEAFALLDDDNHFKEMSSRHNPYGDGNACGRIVEFMKELELEEISS